MGIDITKTTLSQEVPAAASIAEQEALRLQEEMQERYGVSLGVACGVNGNPVLVDESGDEVAEVFPDGSYVICEDEPCASGEDCKDVKDMSVEELAAYILRLQEAIASQDKAEPTTHHAAAFSDSANIYTNPLRDDLVPDAPPVTPPKPRPGLTETGSASPDDRLVTPDVSPAAGPHGDDRIVRGVMPEGAIIASGALAAGIQPPENPAENLFPVADALPAALPCVRPTSNAKESANAHAKPALPRASASERNVPDIVVAGAGKTVSREMPARRVTDIDEAPLPCAPKASFPPKDRELEPERAPLHPIRSAHAEPRNDTADAPHRGAAVHVSVRPSKLHASSDPFAAGSHALYDSNNDPFAIASAAADKGAPPFYQLGAAFASTTAVGAAGENLARVTPAHHRGDQGSRHGHDGDGNGQGERRGRDEDADPSEEDPGVSSVA